MRTIYDAEDMMDMWEVIVTQRFNEQLAIEAANKRKR